jgi:hypothetical protein
MKPVSNFCLKISSCTQAKPRELSLDEAMIP